jgi:DNA-binding HxlR family transcriptional regulator
LADDSADSKHTYGTPLILGDIFLGANKFDEIQRDLEIPRNQLTERLTTLVEHGVLEKLPYQDGRTRYAYQLTDKGRDFATTLVALMNWDDQWAGSCKGALLHVLHQNCGGHIKTRMKCEVCDQTVVDADLQFKPDSGAQPIRGTALTGNHPNHPSTGSRVGPRSAPDCSMRWSLSQPE